MGVTTERVVAVKLPLHARLLLKKRRVVLAIVLIFLFAMLISLFHFALRKVITGPICNRCDEFTYRWELPSPKTGYARYIYVRISVGLYSSLVVAIPVIILIVLNSILIHYLRQHRMTADPKNGGNNHQTNTMKQKSTERKVTTMVVIIIITFIILNMPSAVLFFLESAEGIKQNISKTLYADIIAISNTMVTTGKATNFLLFCLSSESFRKRLSELLIYHANNIRQHRWSVASEEHHQTIASYKYRQRNSQTPMSPVMINLLNGSPASSKSNRRETKFQEDKGYC